MFFAKKITFKKYYHIILLFYEKYDKKFKYINRSLKEP